MEAEREFRSVRNAAAKVLGIGPEEITMKSRFTEDLGADSLDRMNILMEIEEEYKLGISFEAVRNISTVSDAVSVLLDWEHRN